MSTRLNRIFASKFMLWVLFAVLATYFLVGIRPPRGESKYGALFRGDFKGFFQTLHMPRLKLGIDLQGGTYLVLSVGVEKAIENRLNSERRDLEMLFKTEKLENKPQNSEMQVTKVLYSFEHEEAARACFHFVKKHAPALSVTHSGYNVTVSLNQADEQRIRNSVVDQAVSVLENRLNGFGVAGLIVQRHGERQIVVQLPGVDDPERVKSLVTKTALLEFKLVDKEAANEEALLDEFDGELPVDKMMVRSQKGQESGHVYMVGAFPDMTGDHIADARVAYDDYGRIQVHFVLDARGAEMFKKLTGGNIGKRLGIIIDNVMYSAPNIESEIGKEGSIRGSYTAEEARDLALVLRSGSLLAPLAFEQESRVGASLGQDSIEKGLLACLIGLLLILLFSIFYYRTLGLFAMIALLFNLLLVLMFLSYFESTLTLSGIAGMVLTIGMAIDASILIYEKIREDLVSGVSFRQAVESGFSGATAVIIDSQITTFLTGLILFKFGGPVIKGFAVTLMAGIIATVLAGVFFLRSLIDWAIELRGGKPFKF